MKLFHVSKRALNVLTPHTANPQSKILSNKSCSTWFEEQYIVIKFNYFSHRFEGDLNVDDISIAVGTVGMMLSNFCTCT